MKTLYELATSRPVAIPAILFGIAALTSYNDYPSFAKVCAGLGVGFFVGFTWGYCRGMFSAIEMDSDYVR